MIAYSGSGPRISMLYFAASDLRFSVLPGEAGGKVSSLHATCLLAGRLDKHQRVQEPENPTFLTR